MNYLQKYNLCPNFGLVNLHRYDSQFWVSICRNVYLTGAVLAILKEALVEEGGEVDQVGLGHRVTISERT